MSEDERIDAAKVRGCASQVWLVSDVAEGIVQFRGQSDAAIVQGLLAILLRLYSGRPAAEIMALVWGQQQVCLPVVAWVSWGFRLPEPCSAV